MIYTNENWKPPVTYCEPNKVEVQRMTRNEAAIFLKAELATMTFTEETKDRIQALYMAIIAMEELPKRKEEAERWMRKALKVEPVKHGKWENHGNEWLTCSLCDWECAFHYDYCPQCGAKMNKE